MIKTLLFIVAVIFAIGEILDHKIYGLIGIACSYFIIYKLLKIGGVL